VTDAGRFVPTFEPEAVFRFELGAAGAVLSPFCSCFAREASASADGEPFSSPSIESVAGAGAGTRMCLARETLR